MSSGKKLWVFAIVLGIAATAFLASRHIQKPADKTQTASPAKQESVVAPEDEVHAGYAGSASCKECHEIAFAGWMNSNHGLAERDYRKDMDEKTFSP